MTNRAIQVYLDDECRNYVGKIPACPDGVTPLPWHRAQGNSNVVTLHGQSWGETVKHMKHYLKSCPSSTDYYYAVTILHDKIVGNHDFSADRVYAYFA